MAVTVATTFRVQQTTLTGTLTSQMPPAGVNVYEVWVTSTAAFTVADNAAGPAFPFLANDVARLPVAVDSMDNESGRGVFVSGSTTASILWLGLPSPVTVNA